MPPLNRVFGLDEETRAELDRRLIASHFHGYDDHAAWLAGLGHRGLTRAVIWRYARRLKDRLKDERRMALEVAFRARLRYSEDVTRWDDLPHARRGARE